MAASTELIHQASETLEAAVEQAGSSGLGALEVCHAAFERSAALLQSAITQWTGDRAPRGDDACRAIDRLQKQLRIHAALHAGAGAICAEWGRVLGGPGSQAYTPTGEGPPVRVPRSQRVFVEA